MEMRWVEKICVDTQHECTNMLLYMCIYCASVCIYFSRSSCIEFPSFSPTGTTWIEFYVHMHNVHMHDGENRSSHF